MNQLLSVVEDKLVIDKLRLNKTEGNVSHYGDFTVYGTVNLDKDLAVNGTITVDTLHVKNLTSENSGSSASGQWVTNLEDELVSKGFSWTWGNGKVDLSYQSGNRLKLSGGDLDLAPNKSYKIDNTEVITIDSLGPTIAKSNLKELGNLNSLTVTGNAFISEFAYFASGFGRLGLNTDEPNGALSIVENDVELVLGSPNYGRAQIGTYTNHDVTFITDNTDRIVIKNDGKVIFGDATTKSANVTIYGTLNVDTLVSDNRIERFSSLEIKSSRDSTTYGKGIIWTGTGNTKQFIMMAGPDRLYTTESFDLAENQCYYVNGRPVLTEVSLGDTVAHSKLTSVGVLESLTVSGDTNLLNSLTVNGLVNTTALTVGTGNNTISISNGSINCSEISIKSAQDEAFYADVNEIAIGNKNNTRKPLKMFGPVSVGVANPDLDADFTVKGSVKFDGKKFINGSAEPTEGTFNKGDICWNEEPQLHGYVGWVCVTSGTPGTWIPFGAIGR